MIANFEDLHAWFDERARMRTRFKEILPTIVTNDGLVPSSELITDDVQCFRLRRDPSVEVVPHWRVSSVVERVLPVPGLWNNAAVRVIHGRPIVGRALVYGVPLHRAIEDALGKGLAKSMYWLERPCQPSGILFARLFVRVAKQKESNGSSVVIETWEWIGEGVEVYYAHFILGAGLQKTTHFDGALVTYGAEVDVARMFDTSTKVKGVTYEKFFRIDGETPLKTAIDVLRDFFPIRELVDEHFQCSPSWPSALG